MNLRLTFATLAICSTAIFTGAMLNIGLSFGAYWKSLPPQDFLNWFSANSQVIGRTIPIFVIPAVIGLAVSVWLGWPIAPARYLWLAASACLAAVFIVTAVYHLPTNAAFEAQSIGPSQVTATLNTWLWLHALRIALGLAAAVLSVLATVRYFSITFSPPI